MSKSFKFDPDNPNGACNGKVTFNNRRRTRQGVNQQKNSRQQEFNAGVNSAQNNHVNYANAKPYGRWIKLRLNFSGIEQIYVESVISEIVLHFS